MVAVSLQQGILTVVEIDCLTRVLGEGVDVRGEKQALIAYPNHQRAFHPSTKKRVGGHGCHQGKGECPLESVRGRYQGFFHTHAALEIIVDQMHDDFGIGFRAEVKTVVPQFLSEGDIILNNAVVNDGELIVHADMRVGILLRNAAMCGPARMGDADLTGHLRETLPAVHFCNFTRIFANFETCIGQYRHAG